MRILMVISWLLDYPSDELQWDAGELESAINSAREISPVMRERLIALLWEIYGGDLMDAQERYSALFDRGRALSLLLFEHVHGESRDRGQAMVNLMAQYQERGFDIGVRELPDFIPLYLEFLAQCPEMEAREGLANISHILALLSVRLHQRESPYAALLDSLLMISGVDVDSVALEKTVAEEERDDTPEAIDKVWEEEAVTFGADALNAGEQGAACHPVRPAPAAPHEPVPLRWAN